jgi:hypothetical protein
MESSMEVSQKIKIYLPYDTVLPLQDIYPKEFTPEYDRAICTLMFMATLFTIAKLLETAQMHYN